MLRILGFSVIPLHGQLSQSQRLGSLGQFKAGNRKILVATDVASRHVPELRMPDPHLIYISRQRSGHARSRHRH